MAHNHGKCLFQSKNRGIARIGNAATALHQRDMGRWSGCAWETKLRTKDTRCKTKEIRGNIKNWLWVVYRILSCVIHLFLAVGQGNSWKKLQHSFHYLRLFFTCLFSYKLRQKTQLRHTSLSFVLHLDTIHRCWFHHQHFAMVQQPCLHQPKKNIVKPLPFNCLWKKPISC